MSAVCEIYLTYFDAAILGILQGLTEFLPVSSSGHLVLAEALLGVESSGVTFEVLVHLGTLLAICVYFRQRIFRLAMSLFDSSLKQERKIVGYLLIGTIPAGLVGLLFKDFFEAAFSNEAVTAAMLIVTGLILLATRFVPQGRLPIKLPSSVIMGIGQAMAIMPGISRSGSTIAAGLMVGVEPSEAAEFSFLLAIPAIAGAAVLEFGSLMNLESELVGQYLVGGALAFVVGLGAIYVVLAVVRRGRFDFFAYYCFAAGLTGLYLFL